MAAATKSNVFANLVRSAPRGRFTNIDRPYGPEQVLKLRGSLTPEYTLATHTANKLWVSLHHEEHVPALGCLTGNQAVQCVKAGLKAIYLSGWQVAADANVGGDMYPDQSLYPANSGPELAKRINKALARADQIDVSESHNGKAQIDWYQPIVADAEAGFGGMLNCYELTKSYIEAGVAGVHFEDQLGAEKKCGHMGGKVLIPTAQHIRHLNSARLAADVCGVPTVLVARTDAESARLLTSDIDERDHPYIDRQAGRTREGFFRLKNDGLNHSIMRAIEFAPYSDLIWMETSTPNIEVAKHFAEAVRKVHPDQLLAYNCSPSFNWGDKLSESDILKFQRELGAMGYKFQFITLAGFHVNNYGMFDLARQYKTDGMAAYNQLQQKEFAAQSLGYTAVKHQREVGAGYFDMVAQTAAGGEVSTGALQGSTEQGQFYAKNAGAKPAASNTMQARGMATKAAADSIEVKGTLIEQDHTILTPAALQFLGHLHRKFNDRRLKLLDKRVETQKMLNAGEIRPDFLKETSDIRNDHSWHVPSAPSDMADRRVEITGPVDRKMVINALNSGANVFMADFEDSNTPTWRNQLDGQVNLRDAINKSISFTDKKSGKNYRLIDRPAVLNVRPRGWHLPEKHVRVDGQVMSGSLFDFGLFAFHNAQQLLDRGSGPYFYLPKLQHHNEAQLWNDVFNEAEEHLKLPKGSIRCTVLIEHLLAAFQTDEILYALKDHILGLNCGRWDYIFSYIKVHQSSPKHVLQDRFKIGMTTPFMRAYSLRTIQSCHLRGAHAMGGMAAQIPIKSDPEANEKALALVREDKVREAKDGHDGTWVAHPGLVPIAKQVFDDQMPTPNQITKQLDQWTVTREDLTANPGGPITQAGLDHNVDVALGYLSAWLNGTGCVPLYNLMEDAATAEISRAQLWQWRKHQARLHDGNQSIIDSQLIDEVINRKCASYKNLQGYEHGNRVELAGEMLKEFCLREHLDEFLTLDCYDKLVNEGQ